MQDVEAAARVTGGDGDPDPEGVGHRLRFVAARGSGADRAGPGTVAEQPADGLLKLPRRDGVQQGVEETPARGVTEPPAARRQDQAFRGSSGARSGPAGPAKPG